VGGLGLSCGCSYARAGDDGIRCGHQHHQPNQLPLLATSFIFPRLFNLLLVAMEEEVRGGGFEADKWEGTLPRLSARAVEKRQRMIGEALEEMLLPPLCFIIIRYIL
jgi:hypothetical protein